MDANEKLVAEMVAKRGKGKGGIRKSKSSPADSGTSIQNATDSEQGDIQKEPAKIGRPSVYDPDMCNLVLLSATKGATWPAIAEACGIDQMTAIDWCDPESPRFHEPFSIAVTRAKHAADELVVGSLFASAIGHEYEEDAMTPTGRVVRVQKHARSEVGAQKLWLINRRRGEWSDRKTYDADTDPVVALLAAMRGEDGEPPAVPPTT